MNLLMAPLDVNLTIEKLRPDRSPGRIRDGDTRPRENDGSATCAEVKTNSIRHLANLGFVPGTVISIVNEVNGNLIVKIKDSKIAIDRDVARKILVRTA